MSSNCCNASCVPLPANGFTACCTVTSISPTAASRSSYTNNHFLTLAEPFDAHTETIISYRHTKAIRQLPTTYLSTARGKWLEIVHEDNVSNDFRINIKVWYIPLLYGRSFADFGLGGFRLSCARQWAATLLVVPARFFATAVRRLRRKWSK